jgi:putative endonuclease
MLKKVATVFRTKFNYKRQLVCVMRANAWIYILTNKNHTSLYVGVTNNLETRVWEHKIKYDPKSFTAKYNIDKLIYYEGFDSIATAIAREKYIKGKTRKWKEELIRRVNPEWKELRPPE